MSRPVGGSHSGSLNIPLTLRANDMSWTLAVARPLDGFEQSAGGALAIRFVLLHGFADGLGAALCLPRGAGLAAPFGLADFPRLGRFASQFADQAAHPTGNRRVRALRPALHTLYAGTVLWMLGRKIAKAFVFSGHGVPRLLVGFVCGGAGGGLLGFGLLFGQNGRRYPVGVALVFHSNFQQNRQVNPVAVAGVGAHLVLMAHHDGVEIAVLHADAAQYTTVEVDFKVIDNLPTAAFALRVLGVVHHTGGHTLGGAVADTNHAAGAIGFVDVAVPRQGRKAHEPRANRSGLLGVLLRNRPSQPGYRGGEGEHHPFQTCQHIYSTSPRNAVTRSSPEKISATEHENPGNTGSPVNISSVVRTRVSPVDCRTVTSRL